MQGNARKAGGENLIAKAEQGAFFCAQTQAGTHILSDFRAVLKLLKWIGYPGTQMRAEVVQTVLATHPHLHGLGLVCFFMLLLFLSHNSPEGGTLTPSASPRSEIWANSRSAQKTTTVSPTWARCALLDQITVCLSQC